MQMALCLFYLAMHEMATGYINIANEANCKGTFSMGVNCEMMISLTIVGLLWLPNILLKLVPQMWNLMHSNYSYMMNMMQIEIECVVTGNKKGGSTKSWKYCTKK